MLRQEIRDSHVAHQALGLGGEHFFPGFHVQAAGRIGPVDEEGIEVISIEAAQGIFDAAPGIAFPLFRAGHFRSDKHLRARHPGAFHRFPHGCFIGVLLGGIDEAVAIGDDVAQDGGKFVSLG